MSIMQIPVSQTDPFNTYAHRSSFSSNGSSSTSSPNNGNWDFNDVDDSHRRSSKRGVSTFINKLFGMVSDRSNQHLISWNPSGSSFLVCNAARFAQEVLPEHFKHSNFSSFVRQLNMYGFHKINKSPRGQRGNNENEIWEFSHPKFQRGRPDMLEDIKRKAMDSELLRRETGDIHASFAMVQLSQADLLQQFRVLQENFANLLQGFEEMKKVQYQQQIIIKKLSERQGLPSASSLTPFTNQPNLFVTTPSSNSCEPLQTWNPQSAQPQSIEQEIMMPSLYPNQQSQDFTLPLNIQDVLPPSPVSSILLPSLSPAFDDKINGKPGQCLAMQGMNLAVPSQ